MAVENFLTYTEYDPSGVITVTSNRVTFGCNNDTVAYTYKDFGSNFFDSDFLHTATIQPISFHAAANGICFYWMLANVVKDSRSMQLASDYYLGLYVVRGTANSRLYITESYGTIVAQIASTILTFDINYYIELERDETVGTFGTLYCRIYSDAGRTSLLETISLTLRNKTDFRYLYAINSYDENNASRESFGYIEDLELSINQAPIVDAGADKNVLDNQSLAPFSDCSFSDLDGSVVTAKYKIVGEVDTWTEIPQGAYPTLLDAVQAFTYVFNNIGDITASLQVEDNEAATSEDSLTVTVEKYTKTVNVTSSASGAHLSGLNFDPGDGTGFTVVSSPFTWQWVYGSFDVNIFRDIFNQAQFPIFVDNEDDIDISLSPVEIINEIEGAVGLVNSEEEICIVLWLEQNGMLASNPTSCTISLVNCEGTVVHTDFSDTHDEGSFHFSIPTSELLVEEDVYIVRVSIVNSGLTVPGIVRAGRLKKTYVLDESLSTYNKPGTVGEALNDLLDVALGDSALNSEEDTHTLYRRNGAVLKIFDILRTIRTLPSYIRRTGR